MTAASTTAAVMSTRKPPFGRRKLLGALLAWLLSCTLMQQSCICGPLMASAEDLDRAQWRFMSALPETALADFLLYQLALTANFHNSQDNAAVDYLLQEQEVEEVEEWHYLEDNYAAVQPLPHTYSFLGGELFDWLNDSYGIARADVQNALRRRSATTTKQLCTAKGKCHDINQIAREFLHFKGKN